MAEKRTRIELDWSQLLGFDQLSEATCRIARVGQKATIELADLAEISVEPVLPAGRLNLAKIGVKPGFKQA